jgi:putative tricarboxylic transport membrane protein
LTADLLAGLVAIFQWKVLLFLFGGVTLGAIFGALPGLTATMGVAVLTPLTFWVTAEEGLAMLLGIYCGAIPGGGIPAIMINVPGTPASIATSWDGWRMYESRRLVIRTWSRFFMSTSGSMAARSEGWYICCMSAF